MKTLLDSALLYAVRRGKVFPLYGVPGPGLCACSKPDCPSPGKHPRTENGVKDATSDPDQIREWWQRWPDSNIGLATGCNALGDAGLLVVDIDMPRGQASVESLYEEGKEFPPTLTQTTGSGGVHYLYRVPADQDVPRIIGLFEGIDIIGDGSYIIVPPSRHKSGEVYAWQE